MCAYVFVCVCQAKTERPKEMFSLTLLSRSRMNTMNSTLSCHIVWSPYLSHAMTLSFFHLLKCDWLINPVSCSSAEVLLGYLDVLCLGQRGRQENRGLYCFYHYEKKWAGLKIQRHKRFATVAIKADNTSAFLNDWPGWLWATPKAISRCSQNKIAAALYHWQVNQSFVTLVRVRKISWVVLK